MTLSSNDLAFVRTAFSGIAGVSIFITPLYLRYYDSRMELISGFLKGRILTEDIPTAVR